MMDLKWHTAKEGIFPSKRAYKDQEGNLDEECMILCRDIQFTDYKTNEKKISKEYASIPYLKVEQFLLSIDEKDRHYYEIIRDTYNAYYLTFDIDGDELSTDKKLFDDLINRKKYYVNLALSLIKKTALLFGIKLFNKDFFIYSSTVPTKFSYHIMIRNYYIINWAKEGQEFYDAMKMIVDKNKKYYQIFSKFDRSIYSKDRGLRIIKCCKFGKNNIKKGVKNHYSKTFIDNFVAIYGNIPKNTYYLFRFADPKFIESFHPKIEPKEKLSRASKENIDFELIEKIMNNLNKKKNGYLRFIGITYTLWSFGEEYWELYNKFYEESGWQKEEHRRERQNIWNSASESRTKYKIGTLYHYLKEDNPQVFQEIIKKQQHKSDFALIDPARIPEINKYFVYQTYDSKYVKSINEHLVNYKGIIIKSNLGTGKTTVIEEVIKDKNLSVLVLSPRIKFAQSIAKRFDIDIYIEKPNRKNGFIIGNRIVCSMESLYKIEKNDFDIIVFDECESNLSQLCSPTMTGKLRDNLEKFELLFQNAKNIIACDAFVLKRTVDLFITFNIKFIFIQNFYQTEKKAIEYPWIQNGKHKNNKNKNDKTQGPDILHQELIKQLKNGKKCYYVSNSKNILDRFEILLHKNLGPDFSYKYYNSKSSDFRKDFENVNSTWKKYNLIMTSPSITVGINFDEKWFDEVYMCIGAMSCCVRDVIQMHMRVRHFDYLKFTINPYGILERGKLTTVIEIKEALAHLEHVWEKGDMFSEIKSDLRRTSWFENIAITTEIENNLQKVGLGIYNSDNIWVKIITRRYLDFCGYKIEQPKHLIDNVSINIPDIDFCYEDAFANSEKLTQQKYQEARSRQIIGDATKEDKVNMSRYIWERNFTKFETTNDEQIAIQVIFNETFSTNTNLINKFMNIKEFNKRKKLVFQDEELMFAKKQIRKLCAYQIIYLLGLKTLTEETIINRIEIEKIINTHRDKLDELFKTYDIKNQSSKGNREIGNKIRKIEHILHDQFDMTINYTKIRTRQNNKRIYEGFYKFVPNICFNRLNRFL